MGTSSIYEGPTDKNPLLPDDFEDEVSEDQKIHKDNKLDHPWKNTKTALAQFITGRSSNKGRVVRSYVKALGGSSNAAKTAKAGSIATINLGRILSSFVENGIDHTFNQLKIDFRGKSVQSLFSELINIISPNASSKEDIVARKASTNALSQIYDWMDENDLDISTLENIDNGLFDSVMNIFINDFIFERLLKDLHSRFEHHSTDVIEALEKENEMRDYVKSSVDVKLKDTSFSNLNYQQENIEIIMEAIYKGCYDAMEAYL